MRSRPAPFALPLLLATVLSVIVAGAPASAQLRKEGTLRAARACEALQSLKRSTNPGAVRLTPGQVYALKGLNKAGGDHALVIVPGAPQAEERWVALSCFEAAGTASSAKPRPAAPERPAAQTRPARTNATGSTENLLALSWLPAFCEGRSGTRECRLLNTGKLRDPARQLSLHGLWPQPREREYCRVDTGLQAVDGRSDWERLPEPEIDRETAASLARAMPGTRSALHRHEWIKHGTCYQAKGGADEYFDDSLQLLDEINRSPVAAYLAANAGRTISAAELRRVFDRAFGPGAGDRVSVKCSRDGARQLLSELWINLSGEIRPDTRLADLLRDAPKAPRGCNRVTLDLPGLQ
ncbi:ribonuclease T2 family protein [Roseibium aestuarii]|uniref:Ribonuclease T n=1 Tax=Roseibium aestuarii TaxID=2600299 RepID=A0ABW4JYW8_9HYPH|nr:ribonuclease T [Roseibium aestuarii]